MNQKMNFHDYDDDHDDRRDCGDLSNSLLSQLR